MNLERKYWTGPILVNVILEFEIFEPTEMRQLDERSWEQSDSVPVPILAFSSVFIYGKCAVMSNWSTKAVWYQEILDIGLSQSKGHNLLYKEAWVERIFCSLRREMIISLQFLFLPSLHARKNNKINRRKQVISISLNNRCAKQTVIAVRCWG